jgi:hypothetical protein
MIGKSVEEIDSLTAYTCMWSTPSRHYFCVDPHLLVLPHQHHV